MMNMDHRLVQSQQQGLMLTQKMQQAIHILQLNSIQLEQYVQQELETNPLLEQELKQNEPEAKEEKAESSDSQDEFDDVALDLDRYAKNWNDGPSVGPDMSRNPDSAARRDFYENSITSEESFSSLLLRQLRMAAPQEERYRVGERIVGDIDDRGYFTGNLEAISDELQEPLQNVEHMLHVIQRFEPTGVGAQDVVECLLLQINAEYPDEPELRTLVSDHLTALERRQIPKIAKAMGITAERVEELKELLSRLNPWPGFEFSVPTAQYVTPDVIVEKIDGRYEVYLTNDTVPSLRIGNHYRAMLKNGRANKEEKQYIRDKVESAKWLIRNIEQRQNTILRIAKAIVDVQEEFMDKGIEKIKPLTLQEIADVVNVHEATVSRTTRGKYLQTPQGLFEMKFFFSPGLRKDSGGPQSSKSVQSIIKKIVEEEDKRKPLSDQKVANLLKEQGINIARRTVTKYREGLSILPTNLRKEYQ
jgi:RNA polymerase sigma-54 factor